MAMVHERGLLAPSHDPLLGLVDACLGWFVGGLVGGCGVGCCAGSGSGDRTSLDPNAGWTHQPFPF